MFLIAVLILGLLAENPLFSSAQALIALGLITAARPKRSRLKLLLFPLLFGAVFLLAHTLLTPGTRDVFYLLGVVPVSYSPAGLAVGLMLAMRVAAGTLMFFWYAVTAEFPQTRDALLWLRVPEPVVGVLGMTWRYLSVYEEDVGRMKNARTLRLGFDGWRRSLASVTAIGGNTVLRAFDHSERTYLSMRTRGYTGHVTMPPVPPITSSHIKQASRLWLLLTLMLLLYLKT
jgi:cobalt/nickel transport system permease protein